MNTNSICSSCKNESDCIFIQHSETNILVCEEFELEKVVKETIESNVKQDPDKEDFLGLCKNCDQRYFCKFRDNHSVIWHCEEYSYQ